MNKSVGTIRYDCGKSSGKTVSGAGDTNGLSNADLAYSDGGRCYLTTGNPSIVKNGNIYSITVPQTINASNRWGGANTSVDTSITVTIEIS